MATLRIRVGMSDVVILLGPRRSAARRVRALANDPRPVPRHWSPRLVAGIDPAERR